MTRQIFGLARHEARMQLRSLVFWLGVVLVAVMVISEVAGYQFGELALWDRVTDNPGQVTGDETWQRAVDRVLAHGVPSYDAARVWADRMGIVLSFVALFTTAFLVDRDRHTMSHDVLAAKPAGPVARVLGRYLGATTPLLGIGAVTLAVALAVNWYVQGQMGKPFAAGAFGVPALVLLPTLLYVPALTLAMSTLAGRGAVVVPPFLVYLFWAGIAPTEGGFRINLASFIIRTDAFRRFDQALASGLILRNRLLHLGLTAGLLALAAWAWNNRRAGR